MITDGGEDGIGGIALAVREVIAAHAIGPEAAAMTGSVAERLLALDLRSDPPPLP